MYRIYKYINKYVTIRVPSTVDIASPSIYRGTLLHIMHVLNILLNAFTYACLFYFFRTSTATGSSSYCLDPAVVAFVSDFRHSQSVSQIRIRFWSFFIWGNSTRHFRSHWIKGKSKLNCPKAAAEIYDLFVLSDQTKYPPLHNSLLLLLLVNSLCVLSFARKHPL